MQVASNPTGVNGPRPGRTHGRLRNTAVNVASKSYPEQLVARRYGTGLPAGARPVTPALSQPKAKRAGAQASVAKLQELRKMRATQAKSATGVTALTAQASEQAQARAATTIALLAQASASALAGTPSAVPSDVQDTVALGRRMAQSYGWDGRQWAALYELWRRESGWRSQAVNASSGAVGIPQMLPRAHPGIDPEAFLADVRWQLRWGMNYIAQRYGDPVAALQHSNQHGWY